MNPIRYLPAERAPANPIRPWLGLLLAAILLLICAIVGVLLAQSRQADYRNASSELTNLSAVLSQDIARNIELYDLSIQGVVDNLKVPGLAATPAYLRQLILFDRAATAKYLGVLRVLDATGRVTADSSEIAPPRLTFADSDYFQFHLAHKNSGLFIGRPVTADGERDTVVGLSRRISDAEGNFDGVVVGTLQLDYFKRLFGSVKLGPRAAVTLFRDDGTMLMRRPLDPAMIGRIFKPGTLLERVTKAPTGEYEARSAIDGVERLIHFERLGSLPLILVVTASLEDVYADWWHKALGISAAILLCCAVIVGLALLLRRELIRRIEAETALGLLADEDALTGLANRRRFDESLRKTWAAAIRSGAPLSLLLIDADCFKAYNDTFGHPAGDDALRALATCLRAAARTPNDVVARFGGEEFAMILPSTDLKEALSVAEAVRAHVIGLALPHPRSACQQFTVSIGIATCHPHPKDQPRSLITAADAALYDAKDSGRNRSVASGVILRRAA